MHFNYMIITIHQCYICEYYVLHMVFFVSYSDDCSVINQCISVSQYFMKINANVRPRN